MAINTRAKRNAALKDLCGILLPTGTVTASDRQTMVGDYLPSTVNPVGGAGRSGIIMPAAPGIINAVDVPGNSITTG